MRGGISTGARAAFVTVIALAVAGCRAPRTPPHAEADLVTEATGMVRRFPMDSEDFVIVRTDTLDTRFVPDELPIPFRQDGLRVVFSGRILPIPPNVRLTGTPLQLTAIRPLDGQRPY